MVYTKVLQIKKVERLYRSIKYILDDAKTFENSLGGDSPFPLIAKGNTLYRQLASGHHVENLIHSASEMVLTKRLSDQRYGKEERSDLKTGKGVLAHHIIQSFSPRDNLTPEEIHEIGRQTVLELTGGHYQMVMATHIDRGHVHNHIIFSTTNLTTLKKFRWQKGTKRSLEKISDKYADRYGAKIIERKNEWNTHSNYGAYRRQSNFRREIKSRLDFLLKHSTSLTDFMKKAKEMKLDVDFSGKYATYRLLVPLNGKLQKNNVRDDTLSKKRFYSLEKIIERVEKNEVVHSAEIIQTEYEKMVREQESNFEMRLTIEEWQVKEVTETGIYLEVTYGLGNRGLVKIPTEKVDRLEDGRFELFLKKSDYFYFMNEQKSEKNRFMRGDTLMKQLAYNNGQVILNKHPYISRLDNLIKEFEFLSKHEITAPHQFEELKNKFVTQLERTEATLSILEQRIEKLNKLSGALLAFEEGKNIGQEIFERYQVDPLKLNRGRLEKQILETNVERQVLEDRVTSIIGEYKMYENVRDHAYHRKEENTRSL
ncbi:relaxase/mobilization nuclease domain-containing protein [Streptococcus ruminantium]|uniref:relaxase/mobilization nuclease domain-containing protein n=1 Tax=Streptococcus ruminantium TaxID=1917441 RepID=UPI0012DC435C|nr:relaxase/mobilization nuclease domain-containing protein [Streptococcus ruminantium]